MMPFPVYLLQDTPDMKEWLLLVVLGVHFRFLLHSFLRVRNSEVAPDSITGSPTRYQIWNPC
jgi:hypothetical protein